MLEIWTDGSCNPNPGYGSWAFVILRDGELIKQCSGFEENTTNNRMEYKGLIEAFDYITKNNILFKAISAFSDSNLLVRTINLWMPKWKAQEWKRKKSRPISNLDLVLQLDSIVQQYLFEITWVKGHSDIRWNEYCDDLCRKEFHRRNLPCFEDLRTDAAMNYFLADEREIELDSSNQH